MKDYGREQRVADFIRRELAVTVQREMRDPRLGLLSINDVRVTRDLAWADIYVTALNTDDEAARKELLGVLHGAGGFLRSELARKSTLRTVPKLRFRYDDTIEYGAHLEQLINSAVAQDAATSGNTETDDADSRDPDVDQPSNPEQSN